MRPRTHLFTLALALLCAVSLQAADLTVDDILAKNAEAKGGLDKLKALQSVKFTGKMSLGQGMEAPISLNDQRLATVLATMGARLWREQLTSSGFWAGRLFWYFVVLLWPMLYWKVYL